MLMEEAHRTCFIEKLFEVLWAGEVKSKEFDRCLGVIMKMFSQIDCSKAPFPKLTQQTILADLLTEMVLLFYHRRFFLLSMRLVDRSISRKDSHGIL
jgi:hypothetical protein